MSFENRTCELPGCGTVFVGKANARFCSGKCRWKHNSKLRRVEEAMAREKDPEAQRRGKANRAKGARAENEVCHLIRDITGDEVRRNLSQTRDAGGDVKWGPFYFEVKYQQRFVMPEWQKQAVQSAQADGGLVPAVVYRRPNEPFWVSLPFAVFLQMFDALRKTAK